MGQGRDSLYGLSRKRGCSLLPPLAPHCRPAVATSLRGDRLAAFRLPMPDEPAFTPIAPPDATISPSPPPDGNRSRLRARTDGALRPSELAPLSPPLSHKELDTVHQSPRRCSRWGQVHRNSRKTGYPVGCKCSWPYGTLVFWSLWSHRLGWLSIPVPSFLFVRRREANEVLIIAGAVALTAMASATGRP